MADTETLLTILSQCGWHVERRLQAEDLLPCELLSRYPRLPTELERFLAGLLLCRNSDDTVWFLTRENFQPTTQNAFRWNESELMSLEALDGDDDEMNRVRAYWDCHFPFLFAVHSDYDYLAVDLSPETFGRIVHGYMPEPEQSSQVAQSFDEFVEKFIETLRGKAEYPLSLFLLRSSTT
ncbi:MAG: SMI1/KNR4 family protein [Planctomycetaceae bacterium]